MNDKNFWMAALNRSLRTVAQTFVAMVGTSIFLSEVQWPAVLSASVLSGILSIATSIATGLPEVKQ